MVNICVVTNYSAGYKSGQKKASFFMKIENENENGFILWIVKIGYLTLIQSYVKRGKYIPYLQS